jgi:hypothetical protein
LRAQKAVPVARKALFTRGVILSPRGLGIGGDLLKPFLSLKPLKSPQILFHLNLLLWWSVFILHKNEGICGGLSWDYCIQNRLGKQTIGDFSGSRIIPSNPLEYISNTLEVNKA